MKRDELVLSASREMQAFGAGAMAMASSLMLLPPSPSPSPSPPSSSSPSPSSSVPRRRRSYRASFLSSSSSSASSASSASSSSSSASSAVNAAMRSRIASMSRRRRSYRASSLSPSSSSSSSSSFAVKTALQGVDDADNDGEDVASEDDDGDEWDPSQPVDVAVIGAGIGGLCCASILARYGLKVVVCESHDVAGGASHSFVRKGFHFDSGPSFHAGLSTRPSINPLKQVLDVIGEQVACVQYKRWVGYLPEGIFNFVADGGAYEAEIAKVGGSQAASEWRELEKIMEPLGKAASSLPASALRSDFGALLTIGRFLPRLLPSIAYTTGLLDPFSNMVTKVVKDPFLKKLVDLECFVLSGLLADSTITAEMVTMFTERHRANGTIDYPLGGGQSIIKALVRGLRKHGGKLLLCSHVDNIIVEDGRAVGLTFYKTRGPMKGTKMTMRSRKAVVSNASIWDTAKLIPGNSDFVNQAKLTPKTESFMHLHLGIDATGLPKDLECHHLIVNNWEDISAPQNVCIISIPTVFDPSLAPSGHHTVHAYTAGNEPYQIWKGMDRKSTQYTTLKEERSQVLWRALEKVIPDIRARVKVKLVGTPLTHERYLRRSEGTYGPAIKAGEMSFPGAQTSIPGLLCCGDSTMPGIGVPAVAASGLIAAHELIPVWDHLKLLDSLQDAI